MGCLLSLLSLGGTIVLWHEALASKAWVLSPEMVVQLNGPAPLWFVLVVTILLLGMILNTPTTRNLADRLARHEQARHEP